MYKSLMIALVILVVLLTGFLVAQFGGGPNQPAATNPSGTTNQKMKVVATFYPLAEFARAVGGDRVEVITIVPSGTEPHDYEPTPADIEAIQTADVVVLNGAGLDDWVSRLKPELESKGIRVLSMSEALGKQSASDPHFWLDPVLAQEEVGALRDVFISKDEASRDSYTSQADAYIRQLLDLDAAYRSGLTDCAKKTIVASHDAFRYLSERYGFQTLAISGISPEEEPSPRRLSEIARIVRQQGIQYIFFESLVSPRLSDTLARETGTQTIVFNPLEGLTEEESRSGANYISIMRQNLSNLETALQCTAR